MFQYLTPQDFGAVADGKTDDTQAIQKAIDKAGESAGTVYFPAGTYRTHVLTLPPAVCLKSDPTWAIVHTGKTVLIPADEGQECILEVSNALGATIEGLCLDGLGMGANMHGISMAHERHTIRGEHALRIERCKVQKFSGNGINMVGVWAFTCRFCQCLFNKGHGLYMDGTDAFITDNWFSGNGKAGFGCDTWCSAVNFTANRIEWNHECGLKLEGAMRFNITANYIDRSYGPAIVIKPAPNYHKRLQITHTCMPYAISVTGNTISRSGKDAEPGSDRDCHLYINGATGITVTGNSFIVWKDDGPNGRVSPWYGIIVENMSDSVIANNVMMMGAVKELIVDRGGHYRNVIIKDNPGTAMPESVWDVQDPFTPVHFMCEAGDPWYEKQMPNERNCR